MTTFISRKVRTRPIRVAFDSFVSMRMLWGMSRTVAIEPSSDCSILTSASMSVWILKSSNLNSSMFATSSTPSDADLYDSRRFARMRSLSDAW